MQGWAAMTPRVNSVLGDAKHGKHNFGIKVTIEGRHTTIHKKGVGNAYASLFLFLIFNIFISWVPKILNSKARRALSYSLLFYNLHKQVCSNVSKSWVMTGRAHYLFLLQ